ncbi:dTMP kinase [Ensifer sp. ENS11]|uniref:dTMP kinase n=1 Tax=Ensifer sp. ENS11 TaxID=2769291 RepID=UPI001786364A|nr:dTMP kinase [Ensifer sp. ENS11]MBD9490498.1 dTMP kinase [Ensifer sp. ENS11]MDP9633033.1 dTMP kinase [Ensifer adhaerens]
MIEMLSAIWAQQHWPGRLIALEGFDGAGKSTQIEFLKQRLMGLGHDVVLTRQPSDWYRQSELVRSFLDNGGTPETVRALALFAAADRIRHCSEVIAPALARGATVISDRYVFSSVAFFWDRGLDPEFILAINAGIPRPDCAIYLDIEAHLVRERLRARDGDNLKHEENSIDTINRVMNNFKKLAPELHVVPAQAEREEVSRQVWRRVEPAISPERRVKAAS